jgi:hypothetical protein
MARESLLDRLLTLDKVQYLAFVYATIPNVGSIEKEHIYNAFEKKYISKHNSLNQCLPEVFYHNKFQTFNRYARLYHKVDVNSIIKKMTGEDE